MRKLVIVGEDIYDNEPFFSYIQRAIKNIDIIEFFEKKDSKKYDNLIAELDKYTEIIILASHHHYNYISKLFASLTEGSLELIEGELIPTTAQAYDKKSFVIKKDETYINIVEVKASENLPVILLDSQNEDKFFYLLDMDESSCKILTAPLMKSFDVEIVTTTLVDGLVKVKAKSKKYGSSSQFLKAISLLFDSKIIVTDNLARYIIEALSSAKKRVTFAESCTGGKIVSWLLSESGASEVLQGSVISYSNSVKESWLEVSAESLQKHGAVSEQVVKEMCRGILELSSSDFAIAVSGIAGPNGGSSEKPIGTVYIGAHKKGHLSSAIRLNLKGDREYIQEQTVYAAIKQLLELDRALFLKK